jgi:hypothetical protein
MKEKCLFVVRECLSVRPGYRRGASAQKKKFVDANVIDALMCSHIIPAVQHQSRNDVTQHCE